MKTPFSRLITGIALGTAGLFATVVPVQASMVLNSLDIVNAGFESGSLTGWGLINSPAGDNDFGARTNDLSTAPRSPQQGQWYVSARDGGKTKAENGNDKAAVQTGLFQILDVSSYGAAIDAGKVTTSFLGYGYGENLDPDANSPDNAFMSVTLLDVAFDSLAIAAESNRARQPNAWTQLEIAGLQLAPGTRHIKLSLIAERPKNGGNYVDAGFDNISGYINVVSTPLPAAAWLFASGLGMLGWMRFRRHSAS